MMVAEVEYDDKSQTPSVERIRLIEAVYGTHGTNAYATSVINTRTLKTYLSDNWVIGRIK
ncbi:MAG: hypothetical protein CVV50_04135 [Spirochaetae bacterium HGW-Spirochaetae-6]|nr:MAG: hypothetical protein CVV50_04135 [Spirochaetae bacterium HGW-Spirochaetae-6]